MSWKIHTTVLILFLFIWINPVLSQQRKTDSLLHIINTSKDDTNKVNAYNELSIENRQHGLIDTALYYANKALELSLTIKYKKGEASAYGQIRSVYFNRGDFPLAIKYAREALSVYEKLNDRTSIASSLSNMGIIYYEQGDYPQALNFYLKALKIGEKLLDEAQANNAETGYISKIKNGLASRYGNIGLIYYKQKDFEKALHFHFKALKIMEEQLRLAEKSDKKSDIIKYKNGVSPSLGNIGLVYFEQKNYTKSLEFYFKALIISKETGDANRTAIQYSNIAAVYREIAKEHQTRKELTDANENWAKAASYYASAIDLAKKIGNKSHLSSWKCEMGAVLIEQKKYNEAYLFLLSALKLADSIGVVDTKNNCFRNFSLLYEQSNVLLPNIDGSPMSNFENMRLNALRVQKKYFALQDSIYSEENKKQIFRQEMTYEFEKKEALKEAEYQKQMELAEADKRRQQIIIYAVIGGLILSAFFGLFVFRNLKITRKQKAIIENQKLLVEEKQNETLDSIRYAKRIQQSLLTPEKYIERKLKELKK